MTADTQTTTGVEDLDDGLTDPTPEAAPESETDGGGGGPRNLYPNVYLFVAGFLAETYAHEVSEQQTSWRWCPRWFHHTEAVARLEACWKAFEVLRQDPGTGASVFFRDHADPCMTALTAPDGTFAKCSDETHKNPPRLPLTQPPAYLLEQGTQP